MATNAMLGSTAINVQIAAMQITHEIIRGCFQVGELKAVGASIEETLSKEPLSQQACEKIRDLAYQVNQLAERANHWVLGLESEPVASADSLAKMVLATQFDTFNDQLQALKKNVSYTIDHAIGQARYESQRLHPIFEKAVGQYLQTRSYKDGAAADESGQNLTTFNHAVTHLTETQNQFNGAEVEIAYHQDPVQERIDKLGRLVGSCYHLCIEMVFFMLDEVAAEADVSPLDDQKGVNTEKVDQFINNLHEEVGSDLVNFWVWKLLGEKAGENYGLVHRYDDLGILKEAILRTAQSLTEKIMKEEAAELDQEAVYAKLFEIIGGPELENPMVWMKENACYYPQELHHAIQELKFPGREFQVFDDLDEFQLGSAFNPNGILLDCLQPLRFSMPTQKHEYTKILDELAETSSVYPDLKDRIEGMIDELSNKGLADTINFEIWNRCGRKPGENWGVVHRYDDLSVLKEALMVAVRRDVHENFVAKHFADEDDRDAFYAQITGISFGAFEVPSHIDPVAFGKENIVFHLHRTGEALEAVKIRIEQRREQKARESDNAMGQIIQAAIAKNPAAKSLADMLDYIDRATDAFALSGSVEKCKAQIKAKIEGSDFAADLRNQIFIGIWKVNEEPSGDSNYGLNHYLDNLEVLSQVLLNILVEIGVNGEQ
ncbi:MAG: hypothetical protein JSR57_00730 [Verrucomicrobia bacterium]|nr:hypothetical protein [Verrucomicrobiota bacterium]